ncbi:hypothetical protein ACFW9M_30125 [Streptomyces lydicus]|uniref:hypothetical protein n=1 Tax=Streptomyces lydicus TaxID=47763 RepID=UPI0036981DB8
MPTPTRDRPPVPVRPGPVRRAPGPGGAQLVKPYLVAGLVMGGIWALNQGEPLWEHAAKLLVLLFVAAPLLHLARRRRTARHPEHRHRLSFVRLAVAKVALIALALGAGWLLDGAMDHPDLAVAAGLTTVVSLVGPLLHRLLLVRAPEDDRP